MSLLYFLCFLSSILLNCSVGYADPEHVSAVKGENVVLSCLYFNITDSSNCYRVRWVKTAMDTSPEKVIFEWPKKSQDAKRVILEKNEKGQLCLFLQSLERSDEGLYRCEIFDGWDIAEVKNISLKVKDCRILQPEKATLRGPVRLNCHVNSTPSPSSITWVKVKGETSVAVDSSRVRRNGSFLTIQSVSAGDDGWYRCNYRVGQTQHCFDINLQIQEGDFVATTVPVPTTQSALTANEVVQPDEEQEGGGSVIPVVSSVVCGLVLLATLTGLFIYYKRNSQSYTQHQRHTAGNHEDSMEFYENVTLPTSTDSANQINSLYQLQGANMCTFQT